MTQQLRILIVEDDESAIEAYEDSVEEFNDNCEDNVEIQLSIKTTLDEAVNAIVEESFDGAIIDLNLDAGNANLASGNEVIRQVYKKHRFPLKIVSGNLANLDPLFEEEGSSFLRCHDREVENNTLFQDFLTLYKTGITKILGRRGELEAYLSEVFWKHLASDIEDWSRDGITEQILLRYTLAHLNEYLDRSQALYDGREFYIKPPIQNHIATGDVVRNNEGKIFLVVSPACDVAPRSVDGDVPEINAKVIILCPAIKIDRQSWLESSLLSNGDGRRQIESKLDKIIKNQNPKHHFMPEHGDLPATVTDFQNIEVCTIEQYVTFERVATVAVPFMKDIQARFVAYLGRQGQPDLDKRGLKDRYSPNLRGG